MVGARARGEQSRRSFDRAQCNWLWLLLGALASVRQGLARPPIVRSLVGLVFYEWHIESAFHDCCELDLNSHRVDDPVSEQALQPGAIKVHLIRLAAQRFQFREQQRPQIFDVPHLQSLSSDPWRAGSPPEAREEAARGRPED